jgi:uncharacterized membrane protein YhaH (DUF805 family)
VGFATAVRTCLAKYVTFAGRAPRSEFWYFQLFAVCIVYLIPVGVYLVEPATGKVVGVAIVVITLLLHLPGLAVAVRRLHDRNRSGWHYLWMFVPFFGSIGAADLVVPAWHRRRQPLRCRSAALMPPPLSLARRERPFAPPS